MEVSRGLGRTKRWLKKISLVVVAASTLLLVQMSLSLRPDGSELSDGEAIDLRGSLAAMKGVDLDALKGSLPWRIKSAKRLLIVIENWGGCPACAEFAYSQNNTGVPGLWITYQTPPRFKPEKGVTVLRRENVHGIPDEVFDGAVNAILVDFEEKTVTPSPGTQTTWSSYLGATQKHAPYCKVNL